MPESDFDQYSEAYDEALNKGLSLSGEGRDYFAQRRVAWLAEKLDNLCLRSPRPVVFDFGCGLGDTAPHLANVFDARLVVGVDVSRESLAIASARHEGPNFVFVHPNEINHAVEADIIYCNGVFHHIEPAQRAAALAIVFSCLRPGGIFALWENNSWNPGTRLCMRRIEFDRNAHLIAPTQAERMMRRNGFEVLGVTYLFIFPRVLRALRAIEPALARFPFGAQYLTLCRKPFA